MILEAIKRQWKHFKVEGSNSEYVAAGSAQHKAEEGLPVKILTVETTLTSENCLVRSCRGG